MAGIFKKNDIRGKVGDSLTEQIVELIGYSFGRIIGKNHNIALTRDTRKSSLKYYNALSRGIVKSGNNIYNLGIGPTPLTYYAAASKESIDYGIMITGSHNPLDQNGIKFCDSEGQSFTYDTLFKELEEVYNSLSFEEIEGIDETGTRYNGKEIKTEYYNFLKNELHLDEHIDVVIDFGKGATYDFMQALNNENISTSFLREDADGTFDGHPPDPSKVNAFEYIKKSVDHDYDIAIAFDGDGDRVGFMMSNHEIISPDHIAMIFAEDIQDETNEAVEIVIDVKISSATKDYIEDIGGKTLQCQVGHSYIHEKLMHTDAKFAAELSGHYYFKHRYYGFDDGLYTTVRFLNYLGKLSSQGLSIEEKIKSLPQYYSTQEFRDHIPDETQDRIIERLMEYAQKNNADLITLDGVRAEFPHGWCIARKSGTEEALSYRVEGQTPKDRDSLLSVLKKIINSED